VLELSDDRCYCFITVAEIYDSAALWLPWKSELPARCLKLRESIINGAK